MIGRKDFVDYLNNLLACADFNDYAPNGLQVEGRREIRRICTAVTASAESIEKAVQFEADALLVHHGYFWKGESPLIIGSKYQRIAQLINHQINLLAYHLPLDCHPELGNNACLANLLQLEDIHRHSASGTPGLLWAGSFSLPKTTDEVTVLLTDKLGRKPLLVEGTGHSISKIAWCTGAAQDYIEQAHSLGADAYISGEISERTYYQARELGIHYFSAGHHATERFGIQALGEHLAKKFDLQYQFIDSSNPV
ncbi:putative NIF3-like protein 1 [Legionella birminghamensis]|uniref:GTP cyclohydrolase 1 type 2 homolog n=1 Tax=Legionella birminghamensis TaxID=28083 RepID=A0A378I9W7_9GAMM|nr:putative NIF3-like protein 1 [Legionella birminghamensis]STX32018.1 putative NIF3-like protein 1 [Legionella birminghamensis]